MGGVSKADFDRLTPKEQLILTSLGIKPDIPKKKPPPSPRMAERPQPYILKVIQHCQLCKRDTHEYFHMVPEEDSYPPHLVACRIKKDKVPKDLPTKTKEIFPSSCSECPIVLSKQSKQELIRQILKMAPLARAGGLK